MCEKKFRGRCCSGSGCRVECGVTVGIEGFEVSMVSGEKLEAAQQTFLVTGNMKRSLTEFIPTI